MKKVLCLIAGFMLCACATTMTANSLKNELMVKQAVVSSAVVASTACQAGLMKPSDCVTAFNAYMLSQLGINTSLQIMGMNTTDADLQAQIQAAITTGFPVLSFDKEVK